MGIKHDRGQEISKSAEHVSFAAATVPARQQALLDSIINTKLKWTKSEQVSSQAWRTEDSPLKPVDPCGFEMMMPSASRFSTDRMGGHGASVSRDYNKTKTETLTAKTDLHAVSVERVSWERYSHWDRRQQVGSVVTARFSNRGNPDESITISSSDVPMLAKLFDGLQKQAKTRAA